MLQIGSNKRGRIIVASKRSGSSIPENFTQILIDRETIFGNKCFRETREESIAAHDLWLKDQIKNKTKVYRELKRIIKRVRSGERIALVCWCKPKSCHGDNYLKYIERKLNEKTRTKDKRKSRS